MKTKTEEKSSQTPNRCEILRKRIAEIETELRIARKELAKIERKCNHKFGASMYNPQSLNTGADHWNRECTLCGLVQETYRLRTEVIHEGFAMPRCGAEIKVPDFSPCQDEKE